MADQYVQLQTDGTGKKVDTSEVTNTAGAVVERQRVVIASDSIATSDGVVKVSRNSLKTTDEKMDAILTALEEISIVLQTGLNVTL